MGMMGVEMLSGVVMSTCWGLERTRNTAVTSFLPGVCSIFTACCMMYVVMVTSHAETKRQRLGWS